MANTNFQVSAPRSEELIKAKTFLMTNSRTTNFNLYDHLASVLTKILREKIIDAVDIFEDISKKVKEDKFEDEVNFVEKPAKNEVLNFVERLQKLMQDVLGEKKEVTEGEEVDQEAIPKDPPAEEKVEGEQIETEKVAEIDEDIPNLCKDMLIFNHCGFGLGKEETFKITLALKILVKTYNLKKVRFWGKILGIKCNYYIAEVPYSEGLEEVEGAWDHVEEEAKHEGVEGTDVEAEGKAAEGEANQNVEEKQAKDEKPEAHVETVTEPTQELTEGAEQGKEGDLTQGEKPPEGMEEIVLPTPQYEPPPIIPPEENGVGINKYVYFVCTECGLVWKRLPNVTPSQIVAARMMKKFFTGDLMSQVSCYPPFAGREVHYLRAQIARISSNTHISPVGYYYFESPPPEPIPEGEPVEGGEGVPAAVPVPAPAPAPEPPLSPEEGMQEGVVISPKPSEIKVNYVKNPNYTPLSVNKILDGGLESWVHHEQFILQQGRCSWYEKPVEEVKEPEVTEAVEGEVKPEVVEAPKVEEPIPIPEIPPEGAEGTEADKQPEEDKMKPVKETPLPLLLPVSKDKGLGDLPAWTVLETSHLLPQFGIGTLRSINWPGAYGATDGKNFANIYIGFGQKYSLYHYSPPLPSDVQQEYIIGPEITEHETPLPVVEEPVKEEVVEEVVVEPPISEETASVDGDQWHRGTQTNLDELPEDTPKGDEAPTEVVPGEWADVNVKVHVP